MESDAGAEKYHRYHEPDPEMHEMGYGGYGTPEKPIYATMAPDNEPDEVTFRHRDTDFDTWKAPLYNLGDDVTVRAGGAGPTGDISPDWRAAAGRRLSDSPDSNMEYLFHKMMTQLSEFGDVVAKLTSEKPSEGHLRESEATRGLSGGGRGHGGAGAYRGGRPPTACYKYYINVNLVIITGSNVHSLAMQIGADSSYVVT